MRIGELCRKRRRKRRREKRKEIGRKRTSSRNKHRKKTGYKKKKEEKILNFTSSYLPISRIMKFQKVVFSGFANMLWR